MLATYLPRYNLIMKPPFMETRKNFWSILHFQLPMRKLIGERRPEKSLHSKSIKLHVVINATVSLIGFHQCLVYWKKKLPTYRFQPAAVTLKGPVSITLANQNLGENWIHIFLCPVKIGVYLRLCIQN